MSAESAVLATPLRRANVAVVLNASDHDHFAVSGEATFRRACPPWADLTFVADHDIADELGELLADGDVDTVVFASNSLSSAAAQRAIASEGFADRWAEDGPSRDVGALVLHQYLRPDAVLPLAFLGSAELSLVGERARGVRSADIRFRRDWLFADETAYDDRARRFLALAVGYGAQKFCVWTRSQPRYPAQWDRLVWEQDSESLIAACDAGDRLVIASRVPIDLMGSTELLGSLIASCLRTRGCLLVESPATSGSTAFTPALASAIDRGRFVHRLGPEHAGEVDPTTAPYHFFDELIVAPEWRVDEMTALDEPAILRKLEQGGSLVVTFSGPGGSSVPIRLSGQPQYANRANHLASWLLPRLDAFKGDLWSTRGLAEAVVATRDAFQDERLIPHALRDDYVRRHVADALVGRVHGDNVDDNVLATVGAYAGLRALRVPGHENLLAWVAARLDRELPSVVAQALIMVPELETAERRERVLDAATAGAPEQDDPGLLQAYAAVLSAASEPGLVRAAAAEASLGLSVQAELLRAVVRNRIDATDEIVGMAALVRERIDRLALGEGGLEAICLGNAALIELARRQGIGPTAAIRASTREVDARTVENTELVREREEAAREAARYRSVGRQATTALVGLLITMTAAAVAAIFIWFDEELNTRFGFASGVFGLMSTLITFVVSKARAAEVPPWPLSVK